MNKGDKVKLAKNSIAANNHKLYNKGLLLTYLYEPKDPYVVVEHEDEILIFVKTDLEEFDYEQKRFEGNEKSV